MDTVEIRWTDAEACEEDRWTPLDEAIKYAAEPLKECRTVGYLLEFSPTHVAVGQTDGADQIGTIWKIPLGCIVLDAATGRPEIRLLVPGALYDG